MNLGPQQTIALLRLIRKNPLLWNPNHPNYGDKIKQLNVWNRISAYLKADNGRTTFNMYRKLRRSYTTALSKIQKGQANDTLPYYFSEFKFLKPIVERELVEKSSAHKEVLPKGFWSERRLRPINVKNNDLLTGGSEDNGDEVFLYGMQLRVSSHENQIVKQQTAKTSKSTNELNPSDSSDANVNPTNSFSNSNKPSCTSMYTKLTDAEFETFGSYIVSQLRQLDSVATMELMSDIQSLISKKRIEYLKNHKRHKVNLEDSQT